MTALASDAARAFLHWSLTEGVGPMLMTRLVERFGSAEAALAASVRALETVPGIGPRSADLIARARDAADPDSELRAAAAAGVRLVTRADAAYPAGLRRIGDAPLVLYVKGDLQPRDAVSIALVGTRRCSRYGTEQARRFAEALAGVGICVVSGLARGVDSAAHAGALDAGGRTIAVVGCGLHEIYPPENKELAERIAGAGAVVSELPMRAAVRRENFPSRNRIIAGLTLGTLVIEAPQRSGALITARLAAEYNRELFALPGRVNEPNAIGVNRLIKDGAAKLVTCLDDLLDELGEVGRALRAGGLDEQVSPAEAPAGHALDALPASLFDDPGHARPAAVAAVIHDSLSPAERAVFAALTSEPDVSDAVVARCGMPPGEALAVFTALELKGLLKRLPGQRVQRAR